MSFSKSTKRVKNALAYYLLLSVQWIIVHLPLALIYPLMNGMLSVGYRFMTRQREISMNNLKSAYGHQKGDQELEDMTKGCLKNIGREMIELIYYVDRPQKFSEQVTIEGREHLDRVLKHNQGIIGVTAHLGNFPLMFVALVQMGYKVNAIIRPMRDKGFADFMESLCRKWGINLISTTPQKVFLKRSLRALKNKEFLFILLDEDLKDKGTVSVNFLGKKMSTAAGPMLFHQRTGAPILPMFMVKQDSGRYKVVVCPALEIEKKYGDQENMLKNIGSLIQCIEKMVKRYPIQWGGWLNKRWVLE